MIWECTKGVVVQTLLKRVSPLTVVQLRYVGGFPIAFLFLFFFFLMHSYVPFDARVLPSFSSVCQYGVMCADSVSKRTLQGPPPPTVGFYILGITSLLQEEFKVSFCPHRGDIVPMYISYCYCGLYFQFRMFSFCSVCLSVLSFSYCVFPLPSLGSTN